MKFPVLWSGLDLMYCLGWGGNALKATLEI